MAGQCVLQDMPITLGRCAGIGLEVSKSVAKLRHVAGANGSADRAKTQGERATR
jgi:hypothetical protein